MINVISNYDYEAAQRMVHWPLREALLRYLHMIKEQAAQSYENRLKLWAALAPHSAKKRKPPSIPRILKGDKDGDGE